MKRKLCKGLAIAFVVALVIAPSSAFAATKATPRIRLVNYSYTLTTSTPTATIDGRIVYRKRVKIDGHWTKVDAAAPGYITLRMVGALGPGSYAPTRRVKISPGGYFHFAVSKGGYYMLSYAGSKYVRPAYKDLVVIEDFVRITDLRATDASVEPTGGLLVKITATVDAPASVITTDTPQYTIFLVYRGDGGYLGESGGDLMGEYVKPVYAPGPINFGVGIPFELRDEMFTVEAFTLSMFGRPDTNSATATFTPSAFLER